MTISSTLSGYIHQKAGNYDVIAHSCSESAVESASLADLPLKQVAKAVVLHDQDHYMMAVIPSMNKLMLPQLQQMLGRRLQLASEEELAPLFSDCEKGAVPAIGQAFGLPPVWDDQLAESEDIYVEAGDHRHLIHLKKKQFMELMRNKPHGEISCRPEDLYDLTHY
ncbi:aminoacyl-tRNA deacylase [Marinobacterium jannaschii]|uniref:aminoacyl-tRNA deacylase n=1 Tax=Marinobacterium jannaschii TaxID=64970 RepID=UPI00055A020F|nr:YbaK/EbsC family protein [Marinobacterium jannaschii]